MKGWSKTTRISVMMALDTVFLAIELGVGYYASSLALIADAFHMLNDIISLAVGLWAVNLARKESSDRYSYGWFRAEILGAFFNATFLIGLCVTIVLEAIQRFFDPPDINSPEIVLFVGCFGLVSNLLGFFVLGGHGHSHGHDDVEAGHSHADDVEAGHAHDHGAPSVGPEAVFDNTDRCPGEDEVDILEDPVEVVSANTVSVAGHGRSDSRGSTRSKGSAPARGRANSGRRIPATIDEIGIHPASFRNNIRDLLTNGQSWNAEPEPDSDDATAVGDNTTANGAGVQGSAATERTPLMAGANDSSGNSQSVKYGSEVHTTAGHAHVHEHTSRRSRRDSHGGHHHNAPQRAKASLGHSHGDLGMNAMVLHVIGDALGNLGVIVTALIIWKTTWTYRMYADPIVSLFITIIILKTAIPLTKATSKILLQATPDHININDIREDIEDLEGVRGCHHVHVWQLSDTRIVASLHIEVAFPISEYDGAKYMALARAVRKCLHGYGIHSATIQPEFRLTTVDEHGHAAAAPAVAGVGSDGHSHEHGPSAAAASSAAASDASTARATTTAATDVDTMGPSCLLDCVDDCVGKGCCWSNVRTASRTGSPPGSRAGSDHGHGHAH